MKFTRSGDHRSGLLLTLAIVAFMLLATVALSVATRGTDRIVETRDWLTHTMMVLLRAKDAQIAIRDAERIMRGYLLTKDDEFLAAFREHKDDTPAALRDLRGMVADNPAQVQRLDRLDRLVAERLARLDEGVTLRQTDQLAQMREAVGSGAGRRSMAAVSAAFDDFIAAENALLAKRTTDQINAEQAGSRNAVVALLTALSALVVTGVAGLLGFRRALRSERILQATLDGLPQGVLAAGADSRPLAWNARFAEILRTPAIIGGDARVPGGDVVATLAARARAAGQIMTAVTPLPDERSAELIVAPVAGAGFIASVSDVTERLKTEAFNRQAQKMDAIGQMTGGLAHDFNNLLTVVMGSLERLGKLVGDQPQARRHVDLAMMGAERGAQLNRQLLAFARRQPLAPRVLDASAVIEDVDPLLRRTLGERIVIKTIVADGLWPVLADRAQLESALINLSLNARDAIEARSADTGGTLLIELGNTHLSDVYAARELELEPGDYVMLAVTDDGTGMAAEVQARAFDPFFTTKEAGRGTGLGLSQIYGFAKQSGGHAKIYSEIGQGTTIKLFLPRAVSAAAARTETVATAMTWSGERVLVVEDDPFVRVAVLGMFTDLGFSVMEAHDGQSALEALDAVAGAVDLIFTDVVMPGPVSARAMAAQACAKYPHLRVLYTSGYTENSVIHHGRLDPDVQLLSKPYRRDELAARLRDVLA